MAKPEHCGLQRGRHFNVAHLRFWAVADPSSHLAGGHHERQRAAGLGEPRDPGSLPHDHLRHPPLRDSEPAGHPALQRRPALGLRRGGPPPGALLPAPQAAARAGLPLRGGGPPLRRRGAARPQGQRRAGGPRSLPGAPLRLHRRAGEGPRGHALVEPGPGEARGPRGRGGGDVEFGRPVVVEGIRLRVLPRPGAADSPPPQ
mmetsp:Transcript_28143/g.42213  ORF Transcript_28143/g.42213 Transcript_28143/m.42213 type:complete len:202 (+) Transcript_28143:440-1045(+)